MDQFFFITTHEDSCFSNVNLQEGLAYSRMSISKAKTFSENEVIQR